MSLSLNNILETLSKYAIIIQHGSSLMEGEELPYYEE
jgi:hypothetical protein